MHKSACFVAFIVGAAAGGAASWYYAKKKYELIAQEEIDSVKEVFSRRYKAEDQEQENETDADEPTEHVINASSISEYKSKLKEFGYVDYSTPDRDEKKTELGQEVPYVITPDEYGELDEYESISLTYYADGVLADDMDDLVEDVDRVVGLDSLTHFGEYEDDSVFVRNDVFKADYEILLDLRNYSDVLKTMPPKREYQ